MRNLPKGTGDVTGMVVLLPLLLTLNKLILLFSKALQLTLKTHWFAG